MLINADSGMTIAGNLKVAGSFWSRFLGLMGERALSPGEGLLLFDCPSIHTCFMRFPIDVVFLDADMRVVAIAQNVKPWRVAFGPPSAAHVLELPAGALHDSPVEVGDQLSVAQPLCVPSQL